MKKNGINDDRISRKCLGLRTKAGISFSILIIVASTVFTSVLYQTAQGKLRQGMRQRLYDIVSIASMQIDGDIHSNLVDRSQEGDAEYMRIKKVLQNIRQKEPEIRYIYTCRQNADGQIIFIVDAETDPNNISHLGEIYKSAGVSVTTLLRELTRLEKPMVEEKFIEDKWGLWLSGYAPFYRSDGQMEGILGIDIASSTVLHYEHQLLWSAITMFIIIIPAALISGWLLGGKLASPIIKLTAGSEKIIEGDLNYRVSVESSDEVGILAESFNRMTETLQKTLDDRDGEIVQRKKTENLLEQKNEELAMAVRKLSQANRELEEFTYIAAHDLKSPIRAIGNLAGMISNGCRDTLQNEYRQNLDMLVQRSQRLNKFVEDLLKYSTLEQTFAEKKDIDVNDALEDVIAEIKAPKEKIEIKIASEMPIVKGVRTHITQIFQKLLENAVKYMDKPKGKIEINCKDRDDFWEFSVADNGCGIEEKYFDKIFKIFQSLTRRDEIETAGIGLSMVRKIVEINGGKIWVKSKVGTGSTFFFTLAKQKESVQNAELFANTVS